MFNPTNFSGPGHQLTNGQYNVAPQYYGNFSGPGHQLTYGQYNVAPQYNEASQIEEINLIKYISDLLENHNSIFKKCSQNHKPNCNSNILSKK
ncbi:unnamed protein product [Brachionus calyciflorus]|uniref:Uncharacterized protein n=1 Tax=Brachionus calyciflorus TaxID=104777 RepID=A0A813PMD3_9BILA|nr:unnamed protein product [Brachionus calyciflorus]